MGVEIRFVLGGYQNIASSMFRESFLPYTPNKLQVIQLFYPFAGETLFGVVLVAYSGFRFVSFGGCVFSRNQRVTVVLHGSFHTG